MGLVDDIKKQAQQSGANKGKFVYFKENTKVRIRFLQDMEDGYKVPFHDSFSLGINEPCQTLFNRECEFCDTEDLRTRDMYMWSVWDYDAKEVKLMIGAVNNASPIPNLVGMYEAYGTLVDRDFVITQNGKGTGKTFSVVPMDKAKFRNEKAKAYGKQKAYELLDKAFPHVGEAAGASKSSKKSKDDDESDYGSMTAKELYDLCKERDIEAAPKKPAAFYIALLEEADSADEWEDEAEDEKVDYSKLSAKELYKLCMDRDIEVATKKPADYYIDKLESADNMETDDWGDESGDDDEDTAW